MNLKTRGIVLRDYKLDDDRVLTILTEDFGLITAYAGGANRMRSRLAGTTELLCYCDLTLFRGKGGRYSVDAADLVRSFFGLRTEVESLALASYFAELSSTLATHAADAGTYMSLLLNSLHFLENKKRGRSQLKAIFELRALTLSGYMPNLVACGECGEFNSDTMIFFPPGGGLLCGNCGQNAEKAGGTKLSAGVLAAMRHIIYSDPAKLFSFSLPENKARELEKASELYLNYQLERTFDTLEFYRSITGFAGET